MGSTKGNIDGSEFEVLIETGAYRNAEDGQDATKWCVGVAVAPSLGKCVADIFESRNMT